jgi:hypothetical protein
MKIRRALRFASAVAVAVPVFALIMGGAVVASCLGFGRDNRRPEWGD